MSSGSGRHQHNSSSSSSWSPSRHHSNQQPPSPASINNVPRSTFVPEIVIPRRTSSSSSPSLGAAAHSPSAPAGAAYSAGSGSASGLLRPPSQQARYAQGNGPSSASSTGGAYATHYSNNTGTGRYGTGGSSYTSAYDGSAPAPGGSSAPTASHEDSLTDVMGSAGVDLRAEEEAMQSQTRYGAHSHHQTASNNHAYASGSSQPKRSSGGLFLEVYPLSMKVHSIAAMHGLGVEPDVLNYLSLTARTRFRNLAEAMIAAARHRIWSTAHARPPPLYPVEDPSEEPKPMYHEQLISDPTKQLSAIEKAEREEEARARRRRAARVEREAAEQAFLAALLEEEKSGRGTGGGAASSSKNAMEGVVNGDGSKKAGQVSNGSHAAGSDKKGGNAGGGTSSSTGNAEAGSKSKKSKAGADGAAGGGKDGPSDGPKKKKQKKNPAGAAAGADGAAASGAVAGASGAGTGTRVSKKYNLSEDVQKRLTDSTATQLIGGKAYGWMSGSAGGAGAGGKGKKGAKEPVKSKLPAPRFGSDSAKKAGGIEDGDGDYEEEGGAGGSSRARGSKKDVTPVLPPSSKRTDSNSSPSKPHHASGSGSVGAWGDVAARKAAREEADRQRRLRVQMRDALFVLEEEVAGGVQGRGAGANALMKARAKMGVVLPNPFEPAGGGGGGGLGGL
ncbi:hypothetical protein CF319_g5219 [Tilletia indica]|nr:hypothetical protein CF319_g5219 [Tilletia indica]